MRAKRVYLLCASAVGLCLVAAVLFLIRPTPTFEEQYLAPQFTCGCYHKMILEFKDGKVRLHNIEHCIYHEAGSYGVSGDLTVWKPEGSDLELVLRPTARGLDVSDRMGRHYFHFKRDWSVLKAYMLHDLRGNTAEQTFGQYVGDIEMYRGSGSPDLGAWQR